MFYHIIWCPFYYIVCIKLSFFNIMLRFLYFIKKIMYDHFRRDHEGNGFRKQAVNKWKCQKKLWFFSRLIRLSNFYANVLFEEGILMIADWMAADWIGVDGRLLTGWLLVEWLLMEWLLMTWLLLHWMIELFNTSKRFYDFYMYIYHVCISLGYLQSLGMSSNFMEEEVRNIWSPIEWHGTP